MKHLGTIALLVTMAGCTAMSEDATRSNCKVATEALDLASAAVFEYRSFKPGQSVPASLANPLTSATLTQELVCG